MFLYFALLISVVSLHGSACKDDDGFIWVVNGLAWETHNKTPLNFEGVPQISVLATVTGDTALMGWPIWKPGAGLLPTDGTPINNQTPLITITSETAQKSNHGDVKKVTAQKRFQKSGQKRSNAKAGMAGIGKFQQKKKR